MKNPASSLALEPSTKRLKSDGNLDNVDEAIVLAARNHEEWIAERRKNWPSKLRIAEKQAVEDAKQKNVDGAGTAAIDEANSEQHKPQAPGKRIMCRFFLRGKCNAGSKCRFSHERVERESRPAHERVYKRFEAPPKTSLFLRLLQSDHDAEDEKLLGFIEYLFKQKHFEQVPQEVPQRVPIQQVPEQQVPHQESLQQVPEQQVIKKQVPEQQVPLQQVPLQQVPIQQVPEQQVPEQQVIEQQVPIQQVYEQQVPEQKVIEQQAPSQQVPLQQETIAGHSGLSEELRGTTENIIY